MKKTVFPWILTIFLVSESILYGLILRSVFPVPLFQYGSILLCLFFCIGMTGRWDKTRIAIPAGLVFTVIADYFLVLREPRIQSAAMMSFSLAQICYFLFLLPQITSPKKRKIQIILRIAVAIGGQVLALFILKENYDFLSGISVFYYGNLLLNLFLAFSRLSCHRHFAPALLLFALCDALIGLSCADGIYLTLGETSLIRRLLDFPFDLSWAFYLPSQVLIAVSNRYDGAKRKL